MPNLLRIALAGAMAALAVMPASAPAKSSAPAAQSRTVLEGDASWYCIECNGGTQTASGERLNDWAMTAAHKTLPMGTRVRVTNLHNDRSVVVRINDRGPYIKGRIIDVTKGVAHKLGFVKKGIVPVKVEVIH